MKRNTNLKNEIDIIPTSPSKYKKAPQIIIERSNNKQECNGRRSKKTSKAAYLREFTENTSLHGLKYLGEKHKSIAHKIWWSITIGLSIAACAYLIYGLWMKWSLSPVIVSFAESSTPIWKIPFPAITFCPGIRVRQRLFNFTEVCKNQNLTDEELFNYEAASVICDNNCLLERNEFINESIVDKIIELSPPLNNILERCLWREEYDCENIFTPILTNEGLCFTANMLDSKDIFKNDTLQYEFKGFLKNKENKGWASDTGYVDNLPLDTYPRRGIASGKKTSFFLSIIEHLIDRDYLCGDILDGYKISVHSPNVIPKISEQFYWIPLDLGTSLVIKPRMMTTSKLLRNYPPEKRMCYFSNEKELRYFKNYTQENCELECLTNYTIAVCGCATYSMPRSISTPICSVGKLNCTENATEDIFVQQIKVKNNYSDEFYEIGKEVALKCHCLPACTSISYDVEISQTALKWKQYLKAANNDNIKNLSYKVATIDMYFKESNFITTKRSELYGLVDFLANCGGLLGVCLGFSILSIIEIIYFMTLRLVSHFKENRTINA